MKKGEEGCVASLVRFMDYFRGTERQALPLSRVEREEALAYAFFKKLRFAENNGEPFCPKCGCTKHYELNNPDRSKYPVYKCAGSECYKQYTLTSGTLFNSRKLPYSVLLKLVVQFVEGVNGASALQAHFDVGCQYMAAYHNEMKLRDAMASDRDRISLAGLIEMDGLHICKQSPKENLSWQRKGKDRRNHDLNRVIMVVRQRGGATVGFADMDENAVTAHAAMRALVPSTENPHIFVDDHAAYSNLGVFGKLHVVQHAKWYSVPDKESPTGRKSTNLVESANSRIRCGQRGIYRHWDPVWLDLYAAEFGWRETMSRRDNGTAIAELIGLALRHPVSRNFCGYYQHYQFPDADLKRPEHRWSKVFRAT